MSERNTNGSPHRPRREPELRLAERGPRERNDRTTERWIGNALVREIQHVGKNTDASLISKRERFFKRADRAYSAQEFGFRISGIYRYMSGTPWGRVANFGPLTHLCCVGPLVEPKDANQLQATHTADLRVEKTIPFGATEVGIYGDLFNINNQGIAKSINLTSGPNFGVPTRWNDPRTFRLGVRVIF